MQRNKFGNEVDVSKLVEDMLLRDVIKELDKFGVDYDFDCAPEDFDQYCRNLLIDNYVWKEFCEESK